MRRLRPSLAAPLFALLAAAPLAPAMPQESAPLAASDAAPQAAAPVDFARYSERGPRAVATFTEEWRDAARDRVVPIKLWHPDGDGPFPVIVFSHGLGGSRESSGYLGDHLASHGYVTLHLQHPGSDESVWRNAKRPYQELKAATRELDHFVDRPADVTFALDELARRTAQPQWPLHGKLDLQAIGVAGHSFGAWTALAAAGRRFVLPVGKSLEVGDARIKAALPMSAPANRRELENGSYASIRIPCFHMTGTRDDSPIGDTAAADRRLPFDGSVNAERYLLILDGAEHHAFGDERKEGRALRPRDPAHHPLIRAGALAFFDATLRGDAAARAWLRDGGYAAALGTKGTFEQRDPAVTRRE